MFNPNKIGNSISNLRGGATVGADAFQCANVPPKVTASRSARACSAGSS